MKDNEYSFLQKLTPDEFKDKLRPFIVNGREVFERGDYSLVFIDSKETVYALHSSLFTDEEEEYHWWVSVDVLSLYNAHYPDLIKGDDIIALKIKNLGDCYVAVPSKFNSQDWEASYIHLKGGYYLVVVNKKTKETIKIFTSVHTTVQIAIESAYKWFDEQGKDITDLSNWLVVE
jgi:hypothetical protein